ncbi:hypothetical protein [Deinococcus hopiensis]|uniref:hypothetical protein n=1 Tax=Deinococcus hopiensis TaxID=309885 RepID=UPI00111C5C3C|nr:hypothetical protein [Deinococcus hopiensis]
MTRTVIRALLPVLPTLRTFAQVAAPATLLQSLRHPNAWAALFVDARQTVAVDPDGAAAVFFSQGAAHAVKFSENVKLRPPGHARGPRCGGGAGFPTLRGGRVERDGGPKSDCLAGLQRAPSSPLTRSSPRRDGFS